MKDSKREQGCTGSGLISQSFSAKSFKPNVYFEKFWMIEIITITVLMLNYAKQSH